MLKKGNDLYKFVAIDGTLEPSPIRPFNFVGMLREKDFDTIRALVHNTPPANTSIWFGHYPTSSIFYEKTHLHDIIDGPYLCGHFHTLNGLIHNMYATQRSGFLEAEVADWKDERMFRVAAVDHGLFALKDVSLNRWPIILITNPKPALLMMPKYEPCHRISQSTHVRVMIFSPHKIVKVEFRVDDGDWEKMIQSSSAPSLYTHEWKADQYGEGLHKIAVRSKVIRFFLNILQSISLNFFLRMMGTMSVKYLMNFLLTGQGLDFPLEADWFYDLKSEIL